MDIVLYIDMSYSWEYFRPSSVLHQQMSLFFVHVWVQSSNLSSFGIIAGF